MQATHDLEPRLGAGNTQLVAVKSYHEEKFSASKESLLWTALPLAPEVLPFLVDGVQGSKRGLPIRAPQVEEFLRVYPLLLEILKPGRCLGVGARRWVGRECMVLGRRSEAGQTL